MVKKALFGVLVLILGVLILFNNMEIVDLNIGKIWPILILIFGIGDLFDSRRLNITNSILLVIGAYFLLYNYNIINVSFVKIIIPLILIMIGLSLLFPVKISKELIKHTKSDITITSIFSDAINKGESKNFSKANVKTVFGGATLNLEEVTPTNNESICTSTVVFGGLDIIVPDDWEINYNGVTCIFGNVEMKKKKSENKKSTKSKKHVLYLTGIILFGTIEIK